MSRTLSRYLPVLGQLDGYRREDLRGDVQAGLTTGIMLVPQGMAYAMLAGLPPVVGLYAALAPLVVYSILGTSRQLAVGPVAIDSMLVAAGVSAIAPAGTDAYLGYAVLLAFMVGAIQVLVAALRLGALVRFLSHPVISGFTSAAAVVIAASQLRHITGIDLPRSQAVHEVVYGLAARIGDTVLPTLLIGLGSVALLLALRKLRRDLPGALIAVVVTTVLVWSLRLDRAGVAVVGGVPAGLPTPALPELDASRLSALLPTALTIALIGFLEAFAVGRALARRGGYEIEPNRELTGIGLANLSAGLTGAFPVTGGFSRSAVNADAGARSGLAGVITASVVALTLLFLTPLFYFVPRAVLAAIILTAVFGLVDVGEVRHLWTVRRQDLVYLGVTFVATLVFGIVEGIAVGVGVSILALIVDVMRPHTARLGRLPDSEVYRNLARFPEAETDPSVLVVRVDARLYFFNASVLKRRIDELARSVEPPLRAVVLVANGINELDSSGEAALRELLAAYRDQGIRLFLAEVKGPVLDVLTRSGFLEILGADAFCLTTHEAVLRAREGVVPV